MKGGWKKKGERGWKTIESVGDSYAIPRRVLPVDKHDDSGLGNNYNHSCIKTRY